MEFNSRYCGGLPITGCVCWSPQASKQPMISIISKESILFISIAIVLIFNPASDEIADCRPQYFKNG